MNSDLRPLREESCPPHPMLYHELACLFPMLGNEALAELTEDIRVNGVREPIVLYEGKILDGRNRYHAAREIGATYPVAEYVGSDPLGYVVSLNLKRRHLNESQRAAVAAKLANLPPGRPKEVDNPANLPGFEPARADALSQAEAASMLNVSERSVRAAKTVIDHGAPELIATVEAGEVAVSAAAEVAKLPEAEQAEVVAQGPEAVRETAKNIRAGIIEVAMGGGRERPASRKNPEYEPNPLRDAALALRDSAAEVSRIIGAHDGAALRAAFHDDASRDRALAVLADAYAALASFLEIDHARAA